MQSNMLQIFMGHLEMQLEVKKLKKIKKHIKWIIEILMNLLEKLLRYKRRCRYGYGKTWNDIFRYYKKLKENFNIPVLAYQVSGEYSLIKNGIKKKF